MRCQAHGESKAKPQKLQKDCKAAMTVLPFPEFSSPPGSPYGLLQAWVKEAEAREPHDALAASLATVDEDGAPNWRMILVKALPAPGQPQTGFVFFTHAASPKAQELAQGRAALGWHWKSLRRQIRARGVIARVGDAQADAYFATRSRASQLSAWASRQSMVLEHERQLQARVEEMRARFGDGEVARPEFWRGYSLCPLELEFWQDGPARLHQRLVYHRRQLDKPWRRARLYP